MSQDAACKGTNMAETIVANNGKLANVFVYVKEGLGDRTFDVPKDSVTIDQKGCQYHPHVLAVMAGQNIEIRNDDDTTHNIHPTPKDNREWNESQPPKAAAIEKNFAREEIMLPVKCNQHPWMKMYVNVVKTPFFAVTGADGKYEIKGLPPGDYTLAFVQEKLGEQDQKVTLAAKDSKTVDQGFKPLTAFERSAGIRRRYALSSKESSLKAVALPYNRAHHRFAVFTACVTFLLIIAGALVTSNDAGLSVPDWPTSFGSLYKIPHLVGGVRFEHTHRMIAQFVGFLSIILAVWTWRVDRRRWMKYLGVTALGLVIAQGILGGITVLFYLPPAISSAHAALAQTFFCVTVLIAIFTGQKWVEEVPRVEVDERRPVFLL